MITISKEVGEHKKECHSKGTTKVIFPPQESVDMNANNCDL